jgi:NAD(P)-dependent dehydrogenase (short-subunit alcohol dehydrogenase family)
MSKGSAVVAGVGEGLGSAVARRFAAAGYNAVMWARSEDKVKGYAEQIRAKGGQATGMKVDVRVEQEVTDAFVRIEREHGPVEVAVFNAGAQHRKPLLEISADQFEKVWRLGCLGGFVFGREAIRHMLPRKCGTVLYTGATSALRGGANFAAFAATKFGLRAVAQSMAREFGPQGIHVATVIVDGAIDMPAIHQRFGDRIKDLPPDGLLNPDAIAQTYFQLHQQQRSAWSLEVDVRPYCEKF